MIVKGKKTETVELDDEQIKNIVLEYLYTKVLKKVDYKNSSPYIYDSKYEYVDGNFVHKYIMECNDWNDGEWFIRNEIPVYGKKMEMILREATTTDILTLKMIKIIENMK